jgi:uncharacterized cupredoxin-like copper-binding protein
VAATEYAFSVPSKIEGGVVSFETSNLGEQIHEFAFGRILGSHTAADLKQAMMGDEEPKWIEDLAGVPALSPGETVTVTRELKDEGTYFFLCFMPAPDGSPHISHGMFQTFEVQGISDAALPTPDATITASDEGIEVGDGIQGGTITVELKSTGKKDHEFWIGRRNPEAKVKNIEEWFGGGQKGPAPVIFPGGMQTIPPGTSVFEELTLDANTKYLVQDPTNHHKARFQT